MIKLFRIIIFSLSLTTSNCVFAKTIIFVIGPPGAGKTTMLDEAHKKYGWDYSALGAMLRNEINENTEIGRSIKPFLDRGELAPLIYIKEIILRELNKNEELVILDGFPRNKEYYDFLSTVEGDKYFVVVRAPLSELKKRLLARGRQDDDLEIIEKRLQAYQSSLMPFENILLELDNAIEIKTDVDKRIYMEEFFSFVSGVISNDVPESNPPG